jgi:hypothetical protein
MNLKQVAYDAAVRALVCLGLTERAAAAIIGRAQANQPAEWERIVARCQSGETVSRVYVVVKNEGGAMADAFVYAPGEQDNIRHVIDFASQGPDTGSGPGDEQATAEPVFGFYQVSVFDVASELKRALGVSA